MYWIIPGVVVVVVRVRVVVGVRVRVEVASELIIESANHLKSFTFKYVYQNVFNMSQRVEFFKCVV